MGWSKQLDALSPLALNSTEADHHHHHPDDDPDDDDPDHHHLCNLISEVYRAPYSSNKDM